MFKKLKDGWALFREGKAVESAIKLKNWTALGSLVGALLGGALCFASDFIGRTLTVPPDMLVSLGKGLVSTGLGISGIVHVVANKDVGLSSSNPAPNRSDGGAH